MYKKLLLSAVAVIACSWASSGHADTISFSNTTQVQAYNGTSPSNYFGGTSWGTNIGGSSGYDTTGVVINRQTDSISFQFETAFNGLDTSYTKDYGVTVAYADIFLNPILSAAPPAGYQYAISLGDQSRNGGNLPVGLYLVSSDKTSEQVWGSRSSFYYGGKYAPAGHPSEAQYAPTVLTGGTLVAGWTVDVSPYSNGVLDVTLSTTDTAEFDALFDNFDLFWGTADCDNAPLFVAVDAAPVPEPPVLAVMATSLLGLGLLRRPWRSKLRRV